MGEAHSHWARSCSARASVGIHHPPDPLAPGQGRVFAPAARVAGVLPGEGPRAFAVLEAQRERLVMLEFGHGRERELEHVAREVELAASPKLAGDDLQHPRLDDPAFAVAGLEPWIGEQHVKAIDARRRKHAIEIDIDVDVTKREVVEAALPGPLTVALDEGLADLEPHDKPVRVALGQLERELGVGAAKLDLDALIAGRQLDRSSAGLEVLGPKRVDVLTEVPHRTELIAPTAGSAPCHARMLRIRSGGKVRSWP